mmetsp:Transcript_6545/g.16300  ORF Transcript_6545/g.16300 Transcript_6545/m.16300 type:complete len:205 (+) Transcript_6545:364-978(+)
MVRIIAVSDVVVDRSRFLEPPPIVGYSLGNVHAIFRGRGELSHHSHQAVGIGQQPRVLGTSLHQLGISQASRGSSRMLASPIVRYGSRNQQAVLYERIKDGRVPVHDEGLDKGLLIVCLEFVGKDLGGFARVGIGLLPDHGETGLVMMMMMMVSSRVVSSRSSANVTRQRDTFYRNSARSLACFLVLSLSESDSIRPNPFLPNE